jgi:hypothetical protein
VDPANFAVLDDYLMPARLAPYLQACDGDGDEAKARRLYVWNIEVSAAFWGPISGVEIAFRNVLHHELVQHFGRTDWWRHHSVNRDDVKGAIETEERLQRQRARIRGAAPSTADDVVAGLSFGFWSSILGGPSKALEQRKYWHLCLHRAFPRWAYRPGADSRSYSVWRRCASSVIASPITNLFIARICSRITSASLSWPISCTKISRGFSRGTACSRSTRTPRRRSAAR